MSLSEVDRVKLSELEREADRIRTEIQQSRWAQDESEGWAQMRRTGQISAAHFQAYLDVLEAEAEQLEGLAVDEADDVLRHAHLHGAKVRREAASKYRLEFADDPLLAEFEQLRQEVAARERRR